MTSSPPLQRRASDSQLVAKIEAEEDELQAPPTSVHPPSASVLAPDSKPYNPRLNTSSFHSSSLKQPHISVATTHAMHRRDDRLGHAPHPSAPPLVSSHGAHSYTQHDSAHYHLPAHPIPRSSLPPDQLRYGDQAYGTLRPVYPPPQIYYDPSLGTPADFPVDPGHAPTLPAHAVFTPIQTRPSGVSTYAPQASAVPGFHAAATTPPIPQAAWTGSPIAAAQYYGSFGAVAQLPHPQAAATQGHELQPGRPSIFLPPGAPPHAAAWTASPVLSSHYQFFNPFQGASPGMERADIPPEQPWTPPSSATPVRPPASGVPSGFGPVHGTWAATPSSTDPRRPSTGPVEETGTGPASRPGAERERKEYHPLPPARRSEWVMWVGNVPSNVSHEELWRFFNANVPTTTSSPSTSEPWRGPLSIFLISRSSCAFVNFSSQADLDRAVPFFNGLSLRPRDPRCPRMVCRVRRKDDDLRAGVGAQRGVGMHRLWVEQQRQKEDGGPNLRQSSVASADMGAQGEIPDELSQHKSSASFASTNSSFLAHHFPRRYFILKSLTTNDLEESVKLGQWKTQRHNQPILDQAFRTSQDVILIFGANRSGEFFGYAKMIAPSIPRGKLPERGNTLRTSYSSASGMGLRPGQASPGHRLEPGRNRSTPAPIREEEDGEREREATALRSATDPYRLYGMLSTGDRQESIPVDPLTPKHPEDELESSFGNLHVSPSKDVIIRAESPDIMEERERRRSSVLDHNVFMTLSQRPAGVHRAGTINYHSTSLPLENHAAAVSERHSSSLGIEVYSSEPLEAVARSPPTGTEAAGEANAPSSGISENRATSLQVERRETLLVQSDVRSASMHAEHLPSPLRVEQRAASLQLPIPTLTKEDVDEHTTEELAAPPSAENDTQSPSDPLAPPFSLQWIKVGSLSFSKTRHLRNPWNGDREVKVSRDGTEIEPGVGALLLAEWDKLEEEEKAKPPTAEMT